MSKTDVAANAMAQQVKLDRPKVRSKVVVSPYQTKLYVSSCSGNMIAVLNADTLELLGTVKVGGRVWGIALTPDDSCVYRCVGASHTASIVDTASLTVAASVTIEVGEAPRGVVIDD